EVRNSIDDIFLPSRVIDTRWVRFIPIKVNIFIWRARQDCLLTRVNLVRRAQQVLRRICRWWKLDPSDWNTFQEWSGGCGDDEPGDDEDGGEDDDDS
nr:RNA-directed DNA polymerase, eukaryota [Tanacetum cinerariifolium]